MEIKNIGAEHELCFQDRLRYSKRHLWASGVCWGIASLKGSSGPGAAKPSPVGPKHENLLKRLPPYDLQLHYVSVEQQASWPNK